MYLILLLLLVQLHQLRLLKLQQIKTQWHLSLYRIFYLNNLIYLVQTDTTVGFLSHNDKRLAEAKQRPHTQKSLNEVDSLKTLQQNTRIPTKYKKRIRRSKKTTFIYENKESYRKIDINNQHYNFINKHKTIFSTSANKTKEKFDLEFAKEKADIYIYTKNNFKEVQGSSIYKVTNHTIKKIR